MKKTLALAVLAAFVLASPAAAAVLSTVKAAVEEALPKGTRVFAMKAALSDDDTAALKKDFGWAPGKETMVLLAKKDAAAPAELVLVVTEETIVSSGCLHKIFLTADPTGKITSVRYLELVCPLNISIKANNKTFLGQFNDRTADSCFDLRKCIDGVTGATDTSALTAKVAKRTLAMLRAMKVFTSAK
jgi:hypothetical protein